MNYHLIFTLEQINELVYCMKEGPYARVNALMQELQRQCAAQQPPAEQPPPKSPEKPPAPGANANGSG